MIQYLKILTLLITLSCQYELSAAATIKGKLKLPQPPQGKQQQEASNYIIKNSTLLTLNDAEISTYSKEDGLFTFYNVKPGIYVLDVHSSSYYFSQIKIQVLEDDDDSSTIKCIEYMYPGSNKQSIPHPLVLEAHGTYNYFEPRQGFGLFGLLKNPMVLMMIVSFGFMYIMPKMMEGLDEEQREQMQRQMEMQSDPSKMFNNLWSELSGSADADADADAQTKIARRTKRD